MGKTIVLNEKCVKDIYRSILQEAFSPSLEQVRLVKNFLDKNFIRRTMPDVTPNGELLDTPVFVRVSGKTEVETMTPRELVMFLDDKYPDIIKDDNDRIKFFKCIAQKWFYNKIDKNGQLDINIIE